MQLQTVYWQDGSINSVLYVCGITAVKFNSGLVYVWQLWKPLSHYQWNMNYTSTQEFHMTEAESRRMWSSALRTNDALFPAWMSFFIEAREKFRRILFTIEKVENGGVGCRRGEAISKFSSLNTGCSQSTKLTRQRRNRTVWQRSDVSMESILKDL